MFGAVGGSLVSGVEGSSVARAGWVRVHVGKAQPHLIDALMETRLGVPRDDRFWVALHPRLASVYLAALAERVAQADLMPVVTDQSFAYGALNGWQLDTLAQILLSDDSASPLGSPHYMAHSPSRQSSRRASPPYPPSGSSRQAGRWQQSNVPNTLTLRVRGQSLRASRNSQQATLQKTRHSSRKNTNG
jgi:hypothetical protein